MSIKRLQSIVVLASGLVFAASLGLYAWAGFSARYWADDYCYGAMLRNYSLPAAIAHWYVESGNRLSTLAAVAVSEAFGMSAIRFVPLVVLVLLVVAWVVFLWQLGLLIKGMRGASQTGEQGTKHAASSIIGPLSWGWLALVQVYFLALLAPDRLQTIYWRMGTLHYTLPLALLLFNLALLARFGLRTGRFAWAVALLSGGLAFFAAGFSETFAALQAGLYGVGLLALGWWAWRARLQAAARWPGLAQWLLVGVPLLGTLAMMAVMASAPANAWRQAVMPPPDNLLLVIPYSLRYAFDFIISALGSRPLPYALYGLLMAVFALLRWQATGAARPAPKMAGWGLALSLLLTYGLIVCSFAPSAYAGLLYPAGRAQMPAAFILLAGLGLAAGLAAALAQTVLLRITRRLAWGSRAAGWLCLVLLAAFSLYPLRLASIPLGERASLVVRAQRWDARDAQIRAALAGGNRDVLVRQTDVVQSLEDIGPDSSFWINACATLYYGAGSITAKP